MDHHKGSCHCGQVRFEAEVDIERITICNCSICTKKGFLHHRVQPENFRLIAGADILATYQFGTMAAKHHFCPTCGVHVFTRPRAAPELYTINKSKLYSRDVQTNI
ncbi:hypothetical protein PMI16_04805 [Herbaspirillum sp. CF444]|uniref:GFA family protein n=1 Tax=Herbaspirillum sp. CF444 TaxID=1144319 RepID=UPI00027240B5|nr:hypothetical protein PMI16_04805 [Herbaspirillum sp. CF444]